MSTDIESIVNAAVDRALGAETKATTTSSAPATPAPDRLDKLASMMEMSLMAQMANSPAFASQGAPSAVPIPRGYDPDRPDTLLTADKEAVERLTRDGKLLEAAKRFRGTLPGGAESLPFHRGRSLGPERK